MKYKPNTIPKNIRTKNILLSIALLIYGGYGLIINDIMIPAGKVIFGNRRIIHLENEQAFLMFGVILCIVTILLATVVDHYDKRDNEQKYFIFKVIISFIGVHLLIGVLVKNFI